MSENKYIGTKDAARLTGLSQQEICEKEDYSEKNAYLYDVILTIRI